MTLALPPGIARYFAADAARAGDFSECFTADAVVKDEGHTYVGLPAIQAWKAGTGNKYTYTSEPFACEEQGDKTVVIRHLVGNFPGSPLDLQYCFSLEGDRIAALEIGV